VHLYSAFIVATTLKALRRGSHSFTFKQHHACLSFVCVHQMSPPQQLRQQTSNCSSLLIYRPRKDERLSWPSWLTYSGWFTHISGHPPAASRAQDSERTPAKDRCSTAGLRSYLYHYVWSVITRDVVSVSRRSFQTSRLSLVETSEGLDLVSD